jgi:flagellar hook-basal body complex protein FliE
MDTQKTCAQCIVEAFTALRLAADCIDTAHELSDDSTKSRVALEIAADCINKTVEAVEDFENKYTQLLIRPTVLRVD